MGTIFLDEIGDVGRPCRQTPAFLEDGSFYSGGGTEIERCERPVDRRHEPKHLTIPEGISGGSVPPVKRHPVPPLAVAGICRLGYPTLRISFRRCFSARLGRSIAGFPRPRSRHCWPIPGPAMSTNFNVMERCDS